MSSECRLGEDTDRNLAQRLSIALHPTKSRRPITPPRNAAIAPRPLTRFVPRLTAAALSLQDLRIALHGRDEMSQRSS
jgi:hypothetical protein